MSLLAQAIHRFVLVHVLPTVVAVTPEFAAVSPALLPPVPAGFADAGGDEAMRGVVIPLPLMLVLLSMGNASDTTLPLLEAVRTSMSPMRGLVVATTVDCRRAAQARHDVNIDALLRALRVRRRDLPTLRLVAPGALAKEHVDLLEPGLEFRYPFLSMSVTPPQRPERRLCHRQHPLMAAHRRKKNTARGRRGKGGGGGGMLEIG